MTFAKEEMMGTIIDATCTKLRFVNINLGHVLQYISSETKL